MKAIGKVSGGKPGFGTLLDDTYGREAMFDAALAQHTGRLLHVGMIATFGCLNGWTLLTARVSLAAAGDGLFPKFFAQLSGTRRTPVYGLIAGMFAISLAILAVASLRLGFVLGHTRTHVEDLADQPQDGAR